jgi:TIR domain-containing protein
MAYIGEDRKLRIFISYSRKDSSAFADELMVGLELAGFAPFLDRTDIAAGEDWEARLGGLIEQSDTVLFVISPEAVKSERWMWELNRAIDLSKRLAPVVYKPVPERDFPEKLRRLNFVFFDGGAGFSGPLSQLAEGLRVDIDWIREHTQLGELARRWDRRGRPESLLLRGQDFDAAKVWIDAWKAPAPEITDTQRAFIEASEEAETTLLRTEQAQLEQARRAAEDVARLEKEVAALRAGRGEPIKTSASAKVFISYRREDSKWPARQLYNSFLRHLPHGQVFIDIDSIPPGADFVEILEQQVEECEIVLALIGPGWIGNTDPKTGRRRLDNPKDFVRIEISAALSRGIPVVPVLLDGTPMPEVDQLPEDMRMLTRKQAEIVAYHTFETDVNRLIRKLGLSKAKDVTDPNTGN